MNYQELTDIVYMNHYQDTKAGDKTKSILDQLVEIIGAKTNINKINLAVGDKLIKACKKLENTNSTINRKLAVFNKLMTYAYEREYVTKQVKIKLLKVDNKKILYFSEQEEQQLLNYFETKHRVMYYFCIIGFKTGMRMSEILSLTKDSVEDGYIRIYENKASHPRSIPMNSQVKDAVTAIYPDMFIYSLNSQKADHWFKKACRELNLNEDYSIHTMRHTFCSRLVQKGVDLYRIQALAGHKDMRMTQRYGHLADKNLEEAIELL